MKINIKVLEQMADTYGVGPIANTQIAQAIASGKAEKAPAKYEPILIGASYLWNDGLNAYISEEGNQKMYYFGGKNFVWAWEDTLGRVIQGTEALTKWVQGDQKYPEGKANKFMGMYNEFTGQGKDVGGGTAVAEPGNDEDDSVIPSVTGDDDRKKVGGDVPKFEPPSGPVPDRGQVGKPQNPADVIIQRYMTRAKIAPGTKLSKQPPIRLDSDEILDLYKQAQAMEPADKEKLMSFIKTIKVMEEGHIKKSTLQEVIRQIVKGIVQEGFGAYSGTSKKQIDNDKIDFANQIAHKMWGNDWNLYNRKSGENGHAILYKSRADFRSHGRIIWVTPNGKYKFFDNATHKWIDVSNLSEETGTAAVSPVTGPNAFAKKKTMQEMTTTMGGTTGYNIPGAFSRRGGSKKGIEGSEALGYTLTNAGKKEMQRTADKLLEDK